MERSRKPTKGEEIAALTLLLKKIDTANLAERLEAALRKLEAETDEITVDAKVQAIGSACYRWEFM